MFQLEIMRCDGRFCGLRRHINLLVLYQKIIYNVNMKFKIIY